MGENEKACPKCHLTKPLGDFYRNKSTSDGLSSYCRVCVRAANRASLDKLLDREVIERPEFRRCPRCNEEKSAGFFYETKQTAHGLSTYCIECTRALSIAEFHEHYERSKSEEAQRRRKLWSYMHLYGVSADVAAGLLARNRGPCDCCGQPETILNGKNQMVRPLSVDHDHETGQIRGMVCHRCNIVLGQVEDDPVLLGNLIAYLERAGLLT